MATDLYAALAANVLSFEECTRLRCVCRDWSAFYAEQLIFRHLDYNTRLIQFICDSSEPAYRAQLAVLRRSIPQLKSIRCVRAMLLPRQTAFKIENDGSLRPMAERVNIATKASGASSLLVYEAPAASMLDLLSLLRVANRSLETFIVQGRCTWTDSILGVLLCNFQGLHFASSLTWPKLRRYEWTCPGSEREVISSAEVIRSNFVPKVQKCPRLTNLTLDELAWRSFDGTIIGNRVFLELPECVAAQDTLGFQRMEFLLRMFLLPGRGVHIKRLRFNYCTSLAAIWIVVITANLRQRWGLSTVEEIEIDNLEILLPLEDPIPGILVLQVLDQLPKLHVIRRVVGIEVAAREIPASYPTVLAVASEVAKYIPEAPKDEIEKEAAAWLGRYFFPNTWTPRQVLVAC